MENFIDKKLKITAQDREFVGFLRCVDHEMNMILGSATEEKLALGNIMIPGKKISKVVYL